MRTSKSQMSPYLFGMPLIANGRLKHDCAKTKSKGRPTEIEKFQREKNSSESKESNDVFIVEDVESEVTNLPELAVDKRLSSEAKRGNKRLPFTDKPRDSNLKPKNNQVNSHDRNEGDCDSLRSKHDTRSRDSKRCQVKPGESHDNTVLHENKILASFKNNITYAKEKHKTVSAPKATSKPTKSVSVKDASPNGTEETPVEVLTSTAKPKQNGTLVPMEQSPKKSHSYREQNGTLKESLSMQRGFSKLSLISNKSNDSKLPNSVLQMPTIYMEENDKAVQNANESLIESAIPNLLRGQAIVCLVLNILLPGTGTILSGFFILCGGKSRMSSKHGNVILMTLLVNFCVGLSQMFTIALLFVGWFWSIAWGLNMVVQSAEWQKERKLKRAKELQTFALSAFNTNVSGRLS